MYTYLEILFLLSWLLLINCGAAHKGVEIKLIKCIDKEKEALLQFKQGIKTDYCGLVSSWGEQNVDCCQWRGIYCSNHTGHVIMVDLHGNGFGSGNEICLEGIFNPNLFNNLRFLKYLDLSFNDFSQPFPKSIDTLVNLEHLNLSYAGFVGEIPSQLGNLSKLQYLDLNNGHLFYNGLNITSLHWLSHLKLLKYIDLSNIDLSNAKDWVQSVSNLPSLRVLKMDSCQLSSIIAISPHLSYINSSTSLRVVSLSSNAFNETSIFKWLFNLTSIGNQIEYLDLSYNSFSGSLPNELGNMPSLSFLSLANNQIEGPIIPDIFLNLRSLRFLFLNENNFQGSILKILGNLCNLQGLFLGGNKLNDDLFSIIQTLSIGCGKRPFLESLDLSRNLFWGSIPESISTFSSIRELYLNDNLLNGTISQGIGQLFFLEKLDISSNFFEVTLNHHHFSNLSRLRELYLSNNPSLVVDINLDWIPPFQLDMISLRSCKLGPNFPNWLVTQTNFSYLDISNTQIFDTIPSTFWFKSFSMSTNLEYLNISYNKIHGVIPNLSTTLDIYGVLDLSSNYFEGSIPSFFGAYSMSLYLNNNLFSDATNLLSPNQTTYTFFMSDLDLSNNLLSGELPNYWMKFNQLESLHLENNNFVGNIPTSIGALKQLNYLNLQNNSFSGKIPSSFENCTSLVILDLGFNSLSGHIPKNIGNMLKDLVILNLRKNKFSGNIPLSLCELSNLQILDLAINNISGTIPNCINNLTAMRLESSNALNLGIAETGLGREAVVANEEETAVIEWKRVEQRFKTTLGLVKLIDLSSNRLEGKIPNEISSLTMLKSLDLSRNELFGNIPSNIGELKSLELLDLSNNHFSGEIPKSLAEVSSLGTLDLSNNNFFGKIPIGTQLQSFDPSSYSGNPLLCGAPLGQECPGDDEPEPHSMIVNEEITAGENDGSYLGLYVSVVLGFILGFWGVCGSLVLKRSWRDSFFRFFDDMKHKMFSHVSA